MNRLLRWLPLALFVGLGLVAVVGLSRPAERTIHSAMVGKPLPAFALAPIVRGKPGVASARFADGRPRLLNVFASWCVPCAVEAPQLARLKAAGVQIEGIAVRDTGPALADFLARNGDPFAAIGSDPESAVQLALGSSGVPESFVIDGRGRIALQHIGPIGEDDIPEILVALKAVQ